MPLFKIIYNLFLCCIGLITVLLIISIFPITGNYKVLVVQSGSMAPAIKTGSMVVSRPAKEYEVGQIITFHFGKTFITHRVFDKRIQNGQTVYVTKGDANKGSDKNELLAKEIVGRVFLHIPYVGYAVDMAKKPLGFILIIVVPALILIYDETRKILEEVKKMRAQKAVASQPAKAKRKDKIININE